MNKAVLDLLKDVKKIGFLGFGKTNRALLDFLSRDLKFEAVIRDGRQSLPGPVPSDAALLLGEKCFDPAGEEIILLSPSVRRERECVRRLAAHGARLCSDAELFFHCEPKNVYAVTGSDGKSTTAAMISVILAHDGKRSIACGNFGVPMTPLTDDMSTYFVTELSSFMLRYIRPRSARAVITDVTPNHLNWHADMKEYISAKENVLLNARERVFCHDCPISRDFPQNYGAFGIFSVKTPFSELKSLCSAEVYCTLEGGILKKNGTAVMRADELKVRGMHNIKNALAALCMTHEVCKTPLAAQALMSFRGLEHRCRPVFESGGIRYYDSSIDSTPERTRVTLECFDRPITAILGGRSKGLDYTPLADALSRHAAAIILCGENERGLSDFLRDSAVGVPVITVSDYREAIIAARDLGHDTVLTPAATSYDRFSDFEERGRAFLDEIKKIYNE